MKSKYAPLYYYDKNRPFYKGTRWAIKISMYYNFIAIII